MAFDRQSLIGEPPQQGLVLVRVAVSVAQWEATRSPAGSLGVSTGRKSSLKVVTARADSSC
jgi:hypothetical protein